LRGPSECEDGWAWDLDIVLPVGVLAAALFDNAA
jgi:hypothetical protein